MLCSSSLPMRVAGLSVLLEEQKKREMLALYAGDLLWGLLGSVHSICGSTLKAESCTSLYEQLHNIKPPEKAAKTNEFVKKSIAKTFEKYAT